MTGRENIAVIGPPLSGATSLAAALRHRLPGASVLESCDGHVAVAVFVVSAAAPDQRGAGETGNAESRPPEDAAAADARPRPIRRFH